MSRYSCAPSNVRKHPDILVLYVRCGYTFQTDSETVREATDKFGSKEWYQIAKRSCPSNDQNDLAQSYFNQYEKANIKQLLEWQNQNCSGWDTYWKIEQDKNENQKGGGDGTCIVKGVGQNSRTE